MPLMKWSGRWTFPYKTDAFIVIGSVDSCRDISSEKCAKKIFLKS